MAENQRGMEESSNDSSMYTETPVPEPERDLSSSSPENHSDALEDRCESKPSFDPEGIMKALEVFEKDSTAIAESFTALFSSLRLALSEVTCSSVDHMRCFSDAAGRLQESVIEAATKGNRYINSCLRLNEEMRGIEGLAMQLKVLRINVDALDSAVNKLTRLR
ncbi:hypothetical protein NE237_011270 [Protea cynaroides]|uniref:BLOC-1-related complex subunit 6 C-terminal helix domain-containing protein n=1 Tax=Protea cynaroides TaxID=273540 RepID=A0A9Q0GUM6_9MAGN|nr:hypothetical protein NE237_011270 [Protea cynaroides]